MEAKNNRVVWMMAVVVINPHYSIEWTLLWNLAVKKSPEKPRPSSSFERLENGMKKAPQKFFHLFRLKTL